MQRKSPSSHPQDTLEQFQLDQEDQAVVDLAFEEAVEAMITCACHQAVIADPTFGTQPSRLTSSESATVPSATVAVPNCTALSLEQLLQLSLTEPLVSAHSTTTNSPITTANSAISSTTSTSTATTGSPSSPTVFATTTTSSTAHTPSVASYPHQPATSQLPQGMATKGTTPTTKTKQCVPLTGFLAEVFAPEVVAQVNQAYQQSATHKATTDTRQHASNNAQQMANTSYCNCEAQGKACTGNCTPCEEVTMDQLQFEQNSISGNQALYHTTATTSNLTGDEDPVFSYHLYNRSYTHHPCEHDLQTYDPSNDKIEITICKDKHHSISIGDEASMADPELECYELDFANEQELLECIYQDSQDFFNELQLDQLLLETHTLEYAKSTRTTPDTTDTTHASPTHLATDSEQDTTLEPTTRNTIDNYKPN